MVLKVLILTYAAKFILEQKLLIFLLTYYVLVIRTFITLINSTSTLTATINKPHHKKE